MPLYKRPNSDIWWASISVPGRPRVRESTGQTDRKTAQTVYDERKVALRKEPAALIGVTWGKAVLKWLAVEERSNSELLSLRKFSTKFSDRMLASVTPEAIDEALSFCQTAGTYTRYRTMIAAILNLSDVKLKLFVRKDKKKKPRKWLTPEQWAKLYAELPPHMKPMAELAVATGLRQANVLGLTWDRVDIKRKLLWIEAEDMKADEAVGIPLSIDAVRVLKNQLKAQAAAELQTEYVLTYRGKPIKEIKTAFHAACVRAGVGEHDERGHYTGFTWHGFRHTWATWHIQEGTPASALQRLGAWTDPRMVSNYAHHSPGHLASFANNARKKKK